MEVNGRALVYGLLAGLGIFAFYISILTIFAGFGFALSNFKNLWVWILPLAGGFGTQIGLYTSIRHSAQINAVAGGVGTLSGGSMVACCSHFLLNIIPIAGLSGISAFLMTYQKGFFSIGIIANIMGISLLLNHKRKMKGGSC